MATNEEIENAAKESMKSQLDSGASSYSISNRSVTKISIDDLIKAEQYASFKADRQANGLFRVAKMQKRSKG